MIHGVVYLPHNWAHICDSEKEARRVFRQLVHEEQEAVLVIDGEIAGRRLPCRSNAKPSSP